MDAKLPQRGGGEEPPTAAAWHAGNAEADDLAKMAARQQDLPSELLEQYRGHCKVAERAAATVAAIQLRRLRERPRNADGAAIKERVRPVPGLPWRLRGRGAKRRLRLQEGEAPEVLQAFTAGDLLQVKPGAWPSGGLLQAAVLEDAAPLEGVHDLRPPGPWPAEGSLTATNGRLPGLWSCGVCGKGAADSSRAVALARKPCGAAAWQSEPACHDLQDHGSGLRCTRCLLQVSQQHAGQVSRSKCPVPVLTRGGQHWPQGEAGVLAVLGRIRGYRRWCEHRAGGGMVEADAADGEAGGAELPAADSPAGNAGAAKLSEPPAAKMARVEVAKGAGILALAAGPAERRQLKLAARPPGVDDVKMDVFFLEMVSNGKDGHIQHTKGVNATMHLAAATESSIACGAAAMDSRIVFGAAAMDSGIACGAGAMDSSIAFGAGAMGSSMFFWRRRSGLQHSGPTSRWHCMGSIWQQRLACDGWAGRLAFARTC